MQLIGSPDDSSLGFLRSDNARRYVRQLPQYPRQQFSVRFPSMSSGAVDLLEKMLLFDPNKRITGTLYNGDACLLAYFNFGDVCLSVYFNKNDDNVKDLRLTKHSKWIGSWEMIVSSIKVQQEDVVLTIVICLT